MSLSVMEREGSALRPFCVILPPSLSTRGALHKAFIQILSQKSARAHFLRKNIDLLPIHERAKRSFHQKDLHTYEDIFAKTSKELLYMGDIGLKTVEKIRAEFLLYGMKLNDE